MRKPGPIAVPKSSRTNADDRLPLASLGRVEGGDGVVEGRSRSDVRPQSSVPHPPHDLAQRLLGHSRPSTTLDLYTHHQRELDPRVGELFADFSLTEDQADDPEDDSDDGGDAG